MSASASIMCASCTGQAELGCGVAWQSGMHLGGTQHKLATGTFADNAILETKVHSVHYIERTS